MVEDFTQFLVSELRENIKGYVKAYLDGETLVVKIIAINGTTYCFFEDDISYKICNGLSSSSLANYVIKSYHSYINSQYFRGQKERRNEYTN